MEVHRKAAERQAQRKPGSVAEELQQRRKARGEDDVALWHGARAARIEAKVYAALPLWEKLEVLGDSLTRPEFLISQAREALTGDLGLSSGSNKKLHEVVDASQSAPRELESTRVKAAHLKKLLAQHEQALNALDARQKEEAAEGGGGEARGHAVGRLCAAGGYELLANVQRLAGLAGQTDTPHKALGTHGSLLRAAR